MIAEADREKILRTALLIACERIADGPQRYDEANTATGWAEVFQKAAIMGVSTDRVLELQGSRFDEIIAVADGAGND
jgi:hypothetical protein